MPITPFHFGPGALIKVLAPDGFSWTCFALANVLIDLEPITLFIFTGNPAHPWLHTLPGSLAVAIVAATFGRRSCERLLTFWNRQLSPQQTNWLGVSPHIPIMAAWSGALIGTLSHLALDTFMHADVEPLWPLIQGNPWRGMISLESLHWSCIVAGGAALVGWLIQKILGLR
ncbi:hypothetical protein [Propionivibrio sp.]|uniref:hypothetical protein n=1 Tax=Propionivibrio sp. TaxID=2212460 RepID=UPI003BF03C4C